MLPRSPRPRSHGHRPSHIASPSPRCYLRCWICRGASGPGPHQHHLATLAFLRARRAGVAASLLLTLLSGEDSPVKIPPHFVLVTLLKSCELVRERDSPESESNFSI